MTLPEIEVFFRGSSFGCVFSSAHPTSPEFALVRLERADLVTLATLAADILGEEQPLLPSHSATNLAKWVIRFSCDRFGERPFLRETAKALIWHRGIYETPN